MLLLYMFLNVLSRFSFGIHTSLTSHNIVLQIHVHHVPCCDGIDYEQYQQRLITPQSID